MAVITVANGGFDLINFVETWDYYPTISTKTSTKYTLKDQFGLGGIEFTGQNLTYEDGTGPIASGIVNAVSFYNLDGSLSWTISGLTMSAKELRDAAYYSSTYDISRLQTLFSNVQVTLNGGMGDDNFLGSNQADIVYGNLGSDWITGGFGNDRLSGGGPTLAAPKEFDVLDYSRETGGGALNVNLATARAIDSFGSTDVISEFEIIIGGNKNDVFRASDANVYQGFVGGRGTDTFIGGTGLFDAIHYDYESSYGVRVYLNGNGNGTGYAYDTFGTKDLISGINVIRATRGSDTLVGSDAAETFTGGADNDDVNGGNGIDTVDYGYETGQYGVFVNLQKNVGLDTFRHYDTLTSIENVIGTDFRDVITGSTVGNRLAGNGGSDSLSGMAGNDVILGDAGNDRISGGIGIDYLVGGTGQDHFVFDAPLASMGIDTIADFSVLDDTVVLENAIFTALTVVGKLSADSFWMSTTPAAHDTTDRIIYETDTGKLFYDSNGSAAGGQIQIAQLSKNLLLTAADFIVI